MWGVVGEKGLLVFGGSNRVFPMGYLSIDLSAPHPQKKRYFVLFRPFLISRYGELLTVLFSHGFSGVHLGVVLPL